MCVLLGLAGWHGGMLEGNVSMGHRVLEMYIFVAHRLPEVNA